MDDKSTYTKLYADGIPYFEKDLQQIICGLQSNRCVVFSSARRMGTRRFCDYLAYYIEHKTNFILYYDQKNTFSEDTLNNAQQEKERQVVLLLPWYAQMKQSFLQRFSRVMKTKSETMLSITAVDADFYDEPEKYFHDTFRPIEYVVTRQLLDITAMKSLIKTRCTIDKCSVVQQDVDQMIKYSGGCIGILKRMFTLMAVEKVRVTPEYLLQDPAMRMELLTLEHQLRTLSNGTLKRIGLLSETDRIAIPLLQLFVRSIGDRFRKELLPKHNELLEVFLNKSDGIVTLNEIHHVLNTNKSYSIWGTYKAASRFAKAIESRYRLRNIRGKGYQLYDR